ncbi:hypothetical protein V492_05651 [Pseudogymnoascus sp. VKM F-4246]|nr:hypothetical protein V492_05651 [Pseudogymnoascus sp. VKM F-4246]
METQIAIVIGPMGFSPAELDALEALDLMQQRLYGTLKDVIERIVATMEDPKTMFALKPLNDVDMEEITVAEIQQHLNSGRFSSLELTEWTLNRIEQTNSYLGSVIEVNPDAVAIATALDAEREQGSPRGPLHGIPNMATADKMQTTAGCRALVGSVVPRDAHVVHLLRASGAIIIGHAGMSEWASIRGSEESMGYSARGGQVRNPYNLSMSAWGSSSGSAVAVAAGIVVLAYGTETDTSIISPANYAGLVGIKPTVGLTSRAGVIPCSESLDTVGPFGRCTRDAVVGLQAIVGVDERDRYTAEATEHITDYEKFLAPKESLKGAIFGLPMKRVWENVEAIRPRFEEIFQMIRDAGAEIVEVDFPCWEAMIDESGWAWNSRPDNQSEYLVCGVEFYHGLREYLKELKNTSIHSLEDIVAYNIKHRDGAAPGDDPGFPSGQDLLAKLIDKKEVKDETYRAALQYIREQTRENGIDAALTYQPDPSEPAIQLDALLLADRAGPGQQLAAQAGYPVITIPVGVDSDEMGGRPFGLSFQHTAWSEGRLIKWASAVEDLLGAENRPRPMYKEHLATNIPILP